MKKLAYRVHDAADAIGFSRSTLYKDIQSGDLKTICRGRSRRVTHSALLAYLRMLQTSSKAAAAPRKPKAQQRQRKRGGKAVKS